MRCNEQSLTESGYLTKGLVIFLRYETKYYIPVLKMTPCTLSLLSEVELHKETKANSLDVLILKKRNLLFVSQQMTLTADELILHKICATYDIETILGRFGPWEVPHAKSVKYHFNIISCTDFMQNQLISC